MRVHAGRVLLNTIVPPHVKGVVKGWLFCYVHPCVMQEVFLARFLPVLALCGIVLSLEACASNTPGSVKDRSTWARWGYAEGVKNAASH